MKNIRLNFSSQMKQQQRRRELVIVVLTVLLLVLLISDYMTNKQQLMQRTTQPQLLSQQRSISPISEHDRIRQKLAQSLVSSLNTPWYQMLDAIEEVKQSYPDVYLKTISPDAKKGQIVITGQVSQLTQLLGFIDALNAQSIFDDVLPLSQREIVNNGKDIEFSLIIGWHNND